MRKIHLGVVACILTVQSALTLSACGVDSQEQSESIGTVKLNLTGVGTSGTVYRLRNGVFTVAGPTSTQFSTEEDPDAESVVLDLQAGDYSILLEPGWVLEEQTPEGFVPVEAALASENPYPFAVASETNTGIVFAFEAGDDTVELGEGTAEVSIVVDDIECPGTESQCGSTCVDTSVDPANCGDCGTVCSAPGATGVCEGGSCGFECFPGRADCDGAAASGCETDVFSSLNHCGGCGNLCSTPNASPICNAGMCSIGACSPGMANCDGVVANGCELPLNTNPSCGSSVNGGTLSGDSSGPSPNFNGTSEQRFRFQVTENDNGGSVNDLAVRFTLTEPPGVDYVLEAGCDGCTINTSPSGSVTLRWNEQTVLGIPNTDSGREVFVHVAYQSGSACGQWNLQAQGNVNGGPVTCSDR